MIASLLLELLIFFWDVELELVEGALDEGFEADADLADFHVELMEGMLETVVIL